MIANYLTFTVVVSVYGWMLSESQASKLLLLSYLTDIAETLPFKNQCTICALNSEPILWFTFASEVDATLFKATIEKIYNQGQWIGNEN